MVTGVQTCALPIYAEALCAAWAPILLMHANWLRIEPYGLVGALDDDDVAHVLKLAPRTRVRRFKANHVIHRDDPRGYIRAIREFRDSRSRARSPRRAP